MMQCLHFSPFRSPVMHLRHKKHLAKTATTRPPLYKSHTSTLSSSMVKQEATRKNIQADGGAKSQLAATDILAKLLQAGDPSSVAAEHVDSLDEQFFAITSTYIAMAKKENNPALTAQLEGALKVAFQAKQRTLRPEIQMLNRLLALSSKDAVRQDIEQHADVLTMNDGYFVSLLARMARDVASSPEGPQRSSLLGQLNDIQAIVEEQLKAQQQ